MEALKLLTDLHLHNPRQGPGSDASTTRALELAGLPTDRTLQALDIGCGTGASTLRLAKSLDATITAIDFLPAFLKQLAIAASEAGVGAKISTLEASMDALPVLPNSVDLIWSEGAIYNMGFETGVTAWRSLLKSSGTIAISEITWLSADRPEVIDNYWRSAYPGIATAGEKLAILERAGYQPLAYFYLPESDWWEGYYQPLESGLESFLERNGHSPKAQAIVDEERAEIELWKRYGDYYSYGFYIARKC